MTHYELCPCFDTPFLRRWEALETALRAVVDTAGDMAQYKKRWEEGRWWWMSTADQIVPGGPSWYQTCKKAREEGLIH